MKKISYGNFLLVVQDSYTRIAGLGGLMLKSGLMFKMVLLLLLLLPVKILFSHKSDYATISLFLITIHFGVLL